MWGGGATYGESEIDISKNLEISSIVSDRPFHMFVLECAKGYYFGNENEPTYGTGSHTGEPIGTFIENIGPVSFVKPGLTNSVFQFIYQGTSISFQYYSISHSDNLFQYYPDVYDYLEADIRLGNIETNFDLEYQIIASGYCRDNDLRFNFNDEYKTINTQAAEMIKHTAEDLEDKRIFVVATFYEKKTVIDVASSSFGTDSIIVYDGQNHYTDTFMLYDTSGEQISSNDVTYSVNWYHNGDVVNAVQDAGDYQMRATLSTPDPDRVTILLDGVPYNKGTYVEKTLTIMPQPIDPEG